MSHNHKLDQDLHPNTTEDNSNSANLPGQELPEQDLDAVSGGVASLAVLPVMDEIEDSQSEAPDPVDDAINGLPGDMWDTGKAIGETVNKLF